MNKNAENEFVYEDISSSSPKGKLKQMNSAVKAYGNGASTHIDKVIKAISFIVAIGILLIFAAAAVILVMMDQIFTMVAVAVFIVGVILSLFTLFLIYGLGQIITLCKEILRRL